MRGASWPGFATPVHAIGSHPQPFLPKNGREETHNNSSCLVTLARANARMLINAEAKRRYQDVNSHRTCEPV